MKPLLHKLLLTTIVNILTRIFVSKLSTQHSLTDDIASFLLYCMLCIHFHTVHFLAVPKPKNSQKNVNGGGVASPNSTRSSNSNSKSSSGSKSPNGGKAASGGAKSPPMNAARTPDFKVANQKKLRSKICQCFEVLEYSRKEQG